MSQVFVRFLDDDVMVSLGDVIAVQAIVDPKVPCSRCGSLNPRDDIKTKIILRDNRSVNLTIGFDQVIEQITLASMAEAQELL